MYPRLCQSTTNRTSRRLSETHDLVEVEPAGRYAEIAADLRRPQLADEFHRALHAQVAQLVVDDFEIVRGNPQMEVAHFAGVHGEVAGERQRAVVIVEHGDLVDVHAIGL